jgi:hypothetical protein
MKMRMNQRMSRRWRDMNIDGTLSSVTLETQLASLIHAPFAWKEDCLIFSAMTGTNLTLAQFENRTEYQFAVNDVNLDDYLVKPIRLVQLVQQSAKAVMMLASRLESEGRYEVVLSLQYEDYLVGNARFYKCREGENVMASDIEGYESNDVLIIET